MRFSLLVLALGLFVPSPAMSGDPPIHHPHPYIALAPPGYWNGHGGDTSAPIVDWLPVGQATSMAECYQTVGKSMIFGTDSPGPPQD